MLSLSFGKVIGESRDYKIPNNTKPNITPVNRFETSFFSLSYEVQILLFHYRTFRIIASQGIGLFRFSPSDWDGNSLIDRDRTRNIGESYSVNVLQFPTQIGLQYGFSNGMAFGFQAGLLNPNTEYIDNMDALSNSDQKDNIATYRMQFFVPLR